MERMTSRLRQLLARPGLIVAPACIDPLTARIAQQVGFECIYVGGYLMGAHLAVSEPLMTMTEAVETSRRVAASVDLPVVVDAATGWGDPLHTMRTVREFERAGIAAIHIEDQVFPKRAHYHRDYREHTIPAEEMALKVQFACQARRDEDFVIIARTDSMRTEGYQEGVRRARLYREVGADVVMLFPNNDEEARRCPGDCEGIPLAYVNSSGNRVGRPIYATQDLEAMGYKMVVDAVSTVIAAFHTARDLLTRLKTTGHTGLDPQRAIEARKSIEDTIGLEEFYKVEEQTVERGR